jgi:hypothetical protein
MMTDPNKAMEILTAMLEGPVISVLDAKTVLKAYRALCALEGKNSDKVIVMGE